MSAARGFSPSSTFLRSRSENRSYKIWNSFRYFDHMVSFLFLFFFFLLDCGKNVSSIIGNPGDVYIRSVYFNRIG